MFRAVRRSITGSQFWFGQVNSRPLSLFRIGLALIVLKEALYHLPLINVFYTDLGIVPRSAVWELARQPGQISLLDFAPTASSVTLLLLLWIAVGLCLLVGFRTRLMLVLNFVLVLSVYERNPFVVNGADDILRVLSFWAIFIPLNHHFSLDALLARRAGHPMPVTADAFPVRLIQVQVALVYLGAGLFKLLGEPWLNGTALSYVLQLDSWLLPPGKWLGANGPTWLLALITYSVVVVELIFPILMFVPIGQPKLRIVGIGLVGLMHVGIAMTAPLVEFLLILGVSYCSFFAQNVPSDHAAIPTPKITLKTARNGVLGALMFLVLWQNADNFRFHNAALVPTVPIAARVILNVTGLHQAWNLFSPTPVQVDWSIVTLGVFEDNTTVDLRTGAAPINEMPSIQIGPEYRWKQLELIVAEGRAIPLLSAWGEYYCRDYNTPSQPLSNVQLQFKYRYSHALGDAQKPIQSDLLWIEKCS